MRDPAREPPPGRGALHAQIWPRTIRPACLAMLLPFIASRSGRRAIDDSIRAHALPAPVATLVSRVVARTRLWPSERIDIARELVAHFADGLGAGRTPDELIPAFGDPDRAARMIARARKRSRPWWWRALARTVQALGWTLAAVLLCYAGLAARYFLSEPRITRNFAAELNAFTLATPAENRAWPLYLEALRLLGPPPPLELDGVWPTAPEHDRFGEAAAIVREHPEALSTIRRAAALPRLGYIYAGQIDPDYVAVKRRIIPGFDPGPATGSIENPVLMGVLMPAMGELRRFARILSVDAHDAAAGLDRSRFLADVEALFGMADQCLAEPFLIGRMLGLAIDHLACEILLRNLPDQRLLDSADRARLAHRVASLGGGFVRLDAPGERAMWDDLAQRFFSDDGRGDGRLCAGAVNAVYAEFGAVNPLASPLGRVAAPVLAALPSRAEFTARVERMAQAMTRDDAIEPWRSEERTSDAEYDRLLPEMFAPMSLAKSLMGGSHFRSVFESRDRFEAIRASVLIACGLESYRAAHGAYPSELSDLVPDLLPLIPPDPFDGKPLRYRAGPRPTLYSVGPNRVDDRAAPPRNPSSFAALPVRSIPASAQGGDWILYAPPAIQGRE